MLCFLWAMTDEGAEASKLLCGILNLPKSSTAPYTRALKTCLINIAEDSMVTATKEATEINDNKTDI